MKLLIDAGNTRLKWAWVSPDGLRDSGALSHAGTLPADLVDRLGVTGDARPDMALASVAAPEFTAALVTALAGSAGKVERVTTATAWGDLRNGYRNPVQMGVDRWLALVAAWSGLRRALCVVDAGTALTLDAVDDHGQHLGGFIVPGAPLMRRALLAGTGGIGASASLPGAGRDTLPWGRDTDACMVLGGRAALACLVRDSMKALAAQSQSPPRLVVTGGDAPALLADLATEAEHRPLLVLEGLALAVGAR